MERVIKVRAWAIFLNKYLHDIKNLNQGAVVYEQFTGLKDKYDVEIFVKTQNY